MLRDAFYNQIIAGLQKKLDPELFERCAADLLRGIYPTLVPIRGGSDTGMDGAMADGNGPPLPLVTTTQKDVSGNLQKNLRSYIKEGGKRRKCILATSCELTAKRRANLDKAATHLGFHLIQIHSQAAMADLLYRSPPWCKELLNLTGDPPPLSVLALTDRPRITTAFLGRHSDLDWLRTTQGDLLVVGQPGSGKTFLMETFAKEGNGLFVVTDDRTRIADGIRSQQPSALLVDDGHLKRELILHLRHFREEIGADYRIIVNCWPGEKDEVARWLSVAENAVRTLRLITRDQMVEVIANCGIHAPDELVHELINQADGRPGLAVTLCYLCLNGRVRDVALGDALSRDIKTTFNPLLGHDAILLLAAFAVGGDAGISMQTVADQFALNIFQVREQTSKLAAGGVLFEVHNSTLAVRPNALQHTLVRDVFFNGATSLPVDGLLQSAPHAESVAQTLIGAAGRGARPNIPGALLQRFVLASRQEETWREYARLGETECEWALQNHPNGYIGVASVALDLLPQKVIPLLLQNAVENKEEPLANNDKLLRLIGDWIKASVPGEGTAVKNRTVLLSSALKWHHDGGSMDVTLRACQIAMSPAFQDVQPTPGSGRKLRMRSGFLTEDELEAMRRCWKDIHAFLRNHRIDYWTPIMDLIESWAYPGRVHAPVTKSFSDNLRAFAAKMLRDVARLTRHQFALQSSIKRLSQILGVRVRVQLNPVFETLYPNDISYSDWMTNQERQRAAVKALADSWSAQAPIAIAEQLVTLEHQAKAARMEARSHMFDLCFYIAHQIACPKDWLRALDDKKAPPGFKAPFIERIASLKLPGWDAYFLHALDQPEQRPTVLSIVLRSQSVPEALLEKALRCLTGFTELITVLTLRRELSLDLTRRLLQHEDTTIAVAAAVGEWHGDSKGSVRDDLVADWSHVVTNHMANDSSLDDIFKAYPHLAHPWLAARITDDAGGSWQIEDTAFAAVNYLQKGEREGLLKMLTNHSKWTTIAKALVGDDPAIYQQLLNDPVLERLHLAPLRTIPSGPWIDKACLALTAGYSPDRIAAASQGDAWSGWGNASQRWVQWVEHFHQLCSHADPRIREIGAIGRSNAQAHLDRELAEAEREDVYGIN